LRKVVNPPQEYGEHVVPVRAQNTACKIIDGNWGQKDWQ